MAKAKESSEGGYSARDLAVLEGLDAVRKRPGMYIGGTDERALHHLFAEVLDNAMDEAVAGHATRIEVELAAAEGTAGRLTIADNGRGISDRDHERIFELFRRAGHGAFALPVEHPLQRGGRQHQRGKAHGAVGEIHRLSDQRADGIKEQAERGGFDPAAFDQRQGKDRAEQQQKADAVEGRGVAEFDQARCFGAVFDGLGAVKAIEALFLEDLGLGPWEVLILMQVSFILMGMFLDDTAMLVIVAPLYIPLVGALGFDLVWYGVLYTITCQIAYMTPPFGYNLFLMRAMAPPEVSLRDIYVSVTPFVLIMILALVLVMVFPQIALWLPQWHYGG